MTFDADVTVIGAGVIGLAVASEVARPDREVFVLERNENFGREASSRNSGVIHTSILSPRGSWNAHLCAEGLNLIYEICGKYGVGHKRTGKLLIALSEDEMKTLETLYQRKADGIDMRMLSETELYRMEPHTGGKAAIFLPQAGIMDAYGLMSYFLRKAKDQGAQLVCRSEVVDVEKVSGGYKILIKESNGQASLATRSLINCAGFCSDSIAAMAGIHIIKENYKLHHFKGEYYSLSAVKSKMLNKYLIYPLLKSGGLVGIHNVLDLDGRVRLGPDFLPVPSITYAIDDSRKQLFYDVTKELFPFVAYDDIDPESVGVMTRRYANNEPFREYIIRHEQDRGLPGLINIVGIESPGLTASPAIARYVGNVVNEIMKN